jgi:hypothetical protein
VFSLVTNLNELGSTALSDSTLTNHLLSPF